MTKQLLNTIKDTHPQKDLAQLQEYFQQHQERLDQLGFTTSPHAHTEELACLTEKLQKLAPDAATTLNLQACRINSYIHGDAAAHRYPVCNIQWETWTSPWSLLPDIPTFDGWDTTKLEDWLSDIETAVYILKESCACLAEAKSCGLTCTLVYEALQAGMTSEIYSILNYVMQTCTPTHHILWRSNRRTMKH